MKILGLIFVVALYFQVSVAGTDIQNGGGGVKINGKVMTFHEAQINLDSSLKEIPGLESLQNEIRLLDVSVAQKNIFFENIYPSKGRQYFKLKKSKISAKLYKKLIEEYSILFNIDPSKLVLFAITDYDSHSTILLDEFFELTLAEQSALLLHEAAWLISPGITYQEVLTLESSYLDYVKNKSDIHNKNEFYFMLSELLHDPQVALIHSLKADLLDLGLIKEGSDFSLRVPLKDVFGESFVRCYLSYEALRISEDDEAKIGEECSRNIRFNTDVVTFKWLNNLLKNHDLGHHYLVGNLKLPQELWSRSLKSEYFEKMMNYIYINFSDRNEFQYDIYFDNKKYFHNESLNNEFLINLMFN